MHKFLRAVGFSQYQKKKDIEVLLEQMIGEAPERKRMRVDERGNLCEIRGDVADGMGVAVYGEMDEDGKFQMEYYYPYLRSEDVTSMADCSIQRHAEKETYAGLLDEYRVGISLIYYLDNVFDYRERVEDHMSTEVRSANLTGLCVDGKILFPVEKTQKQIEKAQVTMKERSSLIEAAKNGDEDAMESLTIEDIDLYSQVSRRMMKEDVYSIIETTFMPCGVECDQYSVLGEIVKFEEKKNRITGEEVYDFTLNCNDLVFHVGINKKDLLGEPKVGYRFKGQVWMQGVANFYDRS